jgi:hypothetical protein
MSAVTEPQTPAAEPPVTGVAEIDEALAAVRLDGPVSEHHQQLSAAVEVLQQALRSPRQ